MGDAYKGLTIRIGADVHPLNSALSSVSSSAKRAQTMLNRLTKAAKMDPTDARVMQKSIGLVGDKARHSATEMKLLDRAMKQAVSDTTKMPLQIGKFSGNVKEAAAKFKDIYTETEKVRASIKRTDGQLETVYDKVSQIIQTTRKVDKRTADNYVQKLRKQLAGTGETAKKAKEEIHQLLNEGFSSKKSGGLGLKMILGFDKNDVAGLIGAFDRLHESSSKLHADQKALNKVWDFKKAENEMAAARAELRGMSNDYARMVKQFHASGAGDKEFAKAARSAKLLDENLERARANTQRTSESARMLPKSMEAAAAKMRAIKTEAAAVSEKLTITKDRIKALESAKGFDKMAASSERVYVELARAEGEVSDLAYKLKIASASADDFSHELAQAKDMGKKTDAEIQQMVMHQDRLNAEVEKYREKLAAAEGRLRSSSMAAEYREARSEVRSLNAELARLNDLSTHTNAFGDFSRSIRTAGYGLYSTVTPAILMAGRYALQAAEDVDSAYRDMRKTVNGTEEQFEHLKEAAIDFSRTHVTSAETILEIEAMGGQLGIAAENLEAFATTVSNLDIATNMEADDIAEQLGKMASVMGINVDEYDNFGDALVRLGNNMPVMEGDIMNLTTRYMGMGKVVGMEAHEMLGWSAAASATGQKAEAAGSAMQRFISNMESAVNGAEDDLYLWSQVAGMSMDEFKRSFEEDASGTMYKFIEGLGRMQASGESVNQELKLLGINNVRDKQLLEGLANQMANGTAESNLLKNALEMSSDAYHGLSTVMEDGSIEEAGDAMREAERKSEGFSGELGKMKNQAIAAALELGDGLVPLIKAVGGTFEGLTAYLHALPDESKQAIATFAAFLAAIGPVTVGFGSIGAAVSTVSQSLKKFPTGWAKLTMPTKAADALINAFGGVGNAIRFITGDSSKAAKGVENLGMKLAGAAQKAGFAKLALGGIGIGLAVTAITQLISMYEEQQRKAELSAKASESMYARIARAAGVAADAVGKEMGAAITKVDWQGSLDAYDEWVENMASGMDELQRKADETFSNNAVAEVYADTIERILSLMDEDPDGILSADNQAALAAAVKAYNEAVGESIEVTDLEKGKLQDSAGQAIETADAFAKLAENKKYAALQDYYNEEFTTAYKAQLDLTQQLADAQKKLDDAYAVMNDPDIDHMSDEYHAAWMATRELPPVIDELNGKLAEQTTAAELASDQMNLMQKAQTDAATSLDKMIASSPEIGAAVQANEQSITDFTDALNSMGDKAQELSSEQVKELAESWKGNMASIMPVLDQYGLSLDMLDHKKIDGKTFYVTDNGTIFNEQGQIESFEEIELGDKTYYVSDHGSVKTAEKTLKEIVGIKLGEKTYLVSNNGTVDDEMAQLEGLRSVKVYGKHYYVTDDGSIYDEEGKLGQLDDKSLAKKFIEVGDEGSTKKVEDKIRGLNTVKLDGKTAKIKADDQATKVINDVKNSNSDLGTKWVTIKARASSAAKKAGASADDEFATGGISTISIIPRHASGGLIPAHASGALNGIVAKPTLTNIGWVGEDGAEAILHMRNAGGAVIPLSNRRYVKPFAQAVASEMGGGGSSSVVNNVTVSLAYDSSKEARQMALDVASELRSILAMGA